MGLVGSITFFGSFCFPNFCPVDVLCFFLIFLVLIPGVFGLFAVGGPSV